MSNIRTQFKKGKPSWNKGLPKEQQLMFNKKRTQEWKDKMSLRFKGKPLTQKHIEKLKVPHHGSGIYLRTSNMKIGKGNLGKKHILTIEGLKSFKEKMSGENHPRWIKDRSKLIKKEERNDSAYFAWRRSVWQRDNFKCKMKNEDCDGSIIAHHILPWRNYVALRYDINNGITLCHFHHPKKRIKEANLSPYFKDLVKNIN